MTVLLTVMATLLVILIAMVLRLAVTLGRTIMRVDGIHRSLEATLELLSERFDEEDEFSGVDVVEQFEQARAAGDWAVCSFLDRQAREYIDLGEPMPVEDWFFYMLDISALPREQTISMLKDMIGDMRRVIRDEQDADSTLIWRGDQS